MRHFDEYYLKIIEVLFGYFRSKRSPPPPPITMATFTRGLPSSSKKAVGGDFPGSWMPIIPIPQAENSANVAAKNVSNNRLRFIATPSLSLKYGRFKPLLAVIPADGQKKAFM
jgi:hypothetical protein